MNKKQYFQIIIIAVIVSIAFHVLVVPWVFARLSVLPVFSRFRLFNPQAPIVINTVKEVRVSDTGDLQEALGKAKSGLSAVVVQDATGIKVTGGAINLTSDGVFVSTKTVLTQTSGAKYFVRLSDGTTKEFTQAVFDPATNLVFLKAEVVNLPIVTLVNSRPLGVGQKVLLAQGSGVAFVPRAETSLVTTAQTDAQSQVFAADRPGRAFGIEQKTGVLPGAAIINIDGELVGLWDGSAVISADVLKTAQSLYISGNGTITRPLFGFSYITITALESALTGTSEGARVIAVSAGPAANLKVGDIITKVKDVSITSENLLEEQLEKFAPGSPVDFTVKRGAQEIVITVTPGTLK